MAHLLKRRIGSGLLSAYGIGVLIGAVVCALAALVEISSIGLLVIFMLVNLTLILLKWTVPDVSESVPIFLPMLGLVLSLAAFLLTLGAST